MKTILHKINFWNLFIGIIIGAGVGMYAFSELVPDGLEYARVYHMEKYRDKRSGDMMMNHSLNMSSNPYMMSNVTTEKQFVEDMIMHHKAAVTMAEQVLKLNPRAEVKKLANDIISAQTTEIGMMKSWLTNWK